MQILAAFAAAYLLTPIAAPAVPGTGPSATAVPADQQVVQILDRIGFGPRIEAFQHVEKIGVEASIAEQLGSVIWLAGGAVAGGRVLGDWPGLAPERLHQRRDLEVTTDFRSVLTALPARHLRLSAPQLGAVFPGLPPARGDLASLMAA